MMNKKELYVQKKRVWKSYHTPGMPNYAKRKKNCVFVNASNSLEHEQGKLHVAWLLRKKGWDFITEAVESSSGLRRDVVCLDTGMVYEVETSERRAERFKRDENTIVIPLWEESLDWEVLVYDGT